MRLRERKVFPSEGTMSINHEGNVKIDIYCALYRVFKPHSNSKRLNNIIRFYK